MRRPANSTPGSTLRTRFPASVLLLAWAAWLGGAPPVVAQLSCTITQVTDSTGFGCVDPSLDEGQIAFACFADLTGENPDKNYEIFLFDGATIRQITDTRAGQGSLWPSLDGGSIAFVSTTDPAGGGDPSELPGPHDVYLFDGSSIQRITHAVDSERSGGPSLDEGTVAFHSVSDFTGDNPAGNRHVEIFMFDGSTITQVTDVTGGPRATSNGPSLEAGRIAFSSDADFTGFNFDRGPEIFLFDGSGISQITQTAFGSHTRAPSLHQGAIAFQSEGDLTGGNPDGNSEIFLYRDGDVTQITDTVQVVSANPSLSGGAIAFESYADLTGGNPDQSTEIFLYDGSTFTQITETDDGVARRASLDGNAVAFYTEADLTGGNPDGSREVFLATCPALAPPPGPYVVSEEIPGFRFKVHLTAGDRVVAGVGETDCIDGTLCVSGALPGRSELFLRVIGPRPNGFLWLNLVRFTPSRVQVWAEHISSGTMRYYDLAALPRTDSELAGLVDKQAFPPSGSAAGAVSGAMQAGIRAPDLTPWAPERSHRLAPSASGVPGHLTFTSPTFPDFRFTVRIFSGTEEQPVQVESDCIPETICVSGALPGRSELFLRIVGPRPNGLLWVNLVRFTTSQVEVEIEQLSTGARNSYVLDAVPRESDQLPGRVDKEAFSPP